MNQQHPSVSVIIPVKRSQATIRRTVESLLGQGYAGAIEILLVGDRQDPTWTAVQDYIDRGAVRAIEVAVQTHGRDANAKRNIGLRQVLGEVLALTDSDMVLPSHWIATGVALLGEGWDCVTGPMASVDNGFWGTYADAVLLGGKTPRMAHDYSLTAATFGRRGYKPPITANALLTRAAYEATGGLDASFCYSYEDYEWFWRMVAAGRTILCTPRLVAEHYHRQGWRSVVREYRRSGRGCADFLIKHPRAPFARRRLSHLVTVLAMPLVALGLALVAPLVAAAFVMLGACGLAALALAGAMKIHRAEALVFPLVTIALGLSFSHGMASGLARHAGRRLGGRAAFPVYADDGLAVRECRPAPRPTASFRRLSGSFQRALVVDGSEATGEAGSPAHPRAR
jgi:cellulose synthase/poly-beta-1,6-N-acetylglucosamine synthase-like glycosyltransferase